MITRRKKFLVLSSFLMIIGLTLAACQPFAAITDRLSEGIKSSSEKESRVSYLPVGLVNLGTEKLPIGASQSSSQYSGLVSSYLSGMPESMHPDNLPEWIEQRIEALEKAQLETAQSAREELGIPPEYLPEWVRVRLAVAEGEGSEMMQSVASIPSAYLPEWVELRIAAAEAADRAMMEAVSNVTSIPPELLPAWVRQRSATTGVASLESQPETINLVNLGTEKLPIAESQSTSPYSGLVNLGTEKLPTGASQSASPYRGLVNLGTEQLPIAVSAEVLEGNAEVVGIPPEFLPEWVKQRVAFSSIPERAEQLVENGMASTEAETGAKKVLLDVLSKPRIVLEYQRFTGSMVKFNSSLEPEPIVMGLKEPSSSVVIQEIISVGPGWVLIHADEGGSPGKVIGSVGVQDGISFNVAVEVLPEYLGGAMYAMLHTDSGISGQLEYAKGPDTPVYYNGKIINEQLMLMPR